MNSAHAHLILNHIPVIGLWLSVIVLAIGLLKKSEEIKKLSLMLFVIVALIMIPTYLTGEPAEEIIERLPGISHDLIERHEEAALPAAIVVAILGVVALFGVIRARGGAIVPSWVVMASLVLSLIGGGMMAWTAHLGGQIQHPETRPGFQLPAEGPATSHNEDY
ncbi:MAG: hypothetical protein RMM98_08725 [Acidobacteriota bacterium]|nr:hypothetical protein [Blastocatellia bacterium]MDW8239687.1 hypothetical protein [Acidobacteriota bacterium]